MKAWIKSWLNTKPLSSTPDLTSQLLEQLNQARTSHIRDLRTLLDNAAEREKGLAEMVRTVLERPYQRPPVGRTEIPENRETPAIPAENMSDVTVFDEDADAEMIAEQEKELADLIEEQNAEGLTKVA